MFGKLNIYRISIWVKVKLLKKEVNYLTKGKKDIIMYFRDIWDNLLNKLS